MTWRCKFATMVMVTWCYRFVAMASHDVTLQIYSDGGRHHDGRNTANRPRALQRWRVEFYLFIFT
jgi:hypothetical protein